LVVGKYKHMVEEAERRIGKLEDKTDKHGNDLTECRTQVSMLLSATVTQRHSPIALNETGEDILRRSEGDKFIDRNEVELLRKIKELNPLTAYDVQEGARKVLESLRDDTRFAPFKNFAFNEGFLLDLLIVVMSLYLRDKVLPKFGYTTRDVDASDPKLRKVQGA